MDLIITILPVVTKDLTISPRFTPYDSLSRCKFSTLTTRQPLVEFYLLTFPHFPLRKKHKSYFGKNRTHDFRTSRCAVYLLDHSGDEWQNLRPKIHFILNTLKVNVFFPRKRGFTKKLTCTPTSRAALSPLYFDFDLCMKLCRSSQGDTCGDCSSGADHPDDGRDLVHRIVHPVWAVDDKELGLSMPKGRGRTDWLTTTRNSRVQYSWLWRFIGIPLNACSVFFLYFTIYCRWKGKKVEGTSLPKLICGHAKTFSLEQGHG